MCSRLTVTPAWWPNRCPPAVRNPLILDVQINHQRALQGARYRLIFRIQECNDES
ncbi:hypothetical protein FORC31_p038 (plasmid) [Escherichia coli]|nr:hypothetical protein FORC31_p038 [Escherichia coli]